MSIPVDYQIVRLQIAVDYLEFMQVLDGQNDLSQVELGLVFFKVHLAIQHLF